jgi:hypothetical protein
VLPCQEYRHHLDVPSGARLMPERRPQLVPRLDVGPTPHQQADHLDPQAVDSDPASRHPSLPAEALTSRRLLMMETWRGLRPISVLRFRSAPSCHHKTRPHHSPSVAWSAYTGPRHADLDELVHDPDVTLPAGLPTRSSLQIRLWTPVAGARLFEISCLPETPTYRLFLQNLVSS